VPWAAVTAFALSRISLSGWPGFPVVEEDLLKVLSRVLVVQDDTGVAVVQETVCGVCTTMRAQSVASSPRPGRGPC
jgi:hypothetical protein